MAHVFLTGMMGSGKTSIAKILSQRLSVPYYDLDEDIARRMGMSIQEVFHRFGSERFREEEAKTIRSHITESGGVWALGGGALLNPGIPELLQEHGVLILLTVPVAVLAKRLENDRNRPHLNGCTTHEERVNRIEELLRERESTYRLSKIEIQFDGSETLDVASNKVLDELKRRRFRFRSLHSPSKQK